MGLYDYRHVIANERTCYWFIHRLRWPDGVRCSGCGKSRVWAMRERGIVRYRCKDCGLHFSLRTGTLLEGSRLPLTKWVLAIGLLRVGLSSRALARELSVSRQSAWEVLHRLRDALQNDVLARKLRGRIEVDETYVGGRYKGKRGRGAAHKTVVLGLKVRKGRVRRLGFRHRRVKHSARFVRGTTHTQSIEGHWGHVKPNLVPRHRSVSPKHLQRYLVEADFKHRWPEDVDFIAVVLRCLVAPRTVLPIK